MRWLPFLLLLPGCGALETLPEKLFDRRTARERYEAGLDAAGLAATGLVRDWRAAGERALAAAPVVSLPIEEQGYFTPGEPAALSWRVAVRRGQRLSLMVSFAADSTARIFLEVWRQAPDSSRAFERIVEADSGERSLHWSPRRDGELIVRIQPELLRGGRFTARLAVDPVLAFPVEKRSEQDIKSRFGAPREAAVATITAWTSSRRGVRRYSPGRPEPSAGWRRPPWAARWCGSATPMGTRSTTRTSIARP
jgi:hypothetical protein